MKANRLSAVSAAVRLLGRQRSFRRYTGLWDSLLDRLCGDDHRERQRFPDPGLLAAAEGKALYQGGRALQGVGGQGVVDQAGHSGARSGLDVFRLPARGTDRGRYRDPAGVEGRLSYDRQEKLRFPCSQGRGLCKAAEAGNAAVYSEALCGL